MDNSSAVSQKINELFGNTPGRVMVLPSGDEGRLPNHAGAEYDSVSATEIGISKVLTDTSFMSAWYSASAPAEVSISFDDETLVGPVGPGSSISENGITIINYLPGTEFYPWRSSSGDRAVWMRVDGHATTGSFKIQGLNPGSGYVDLYGDVLGPNLTPIISMNDHLVPGRLTDYATTSSAIVVANHVARTQWIDIDGVPREILDEGDTGALWLKSSGGPTRDGRAHGVDVSAPGQNLFTSLSQNSYWSTLRGNMPSGSEDLYTRFGGTSGSAPIVVGAVALLLEVAPTLTAENVREILRDTAVSDGNTGTLPSTDWGFGKLDMFEALTVATTLESCVSTDTRPCLTNRFQVSSDWHSTIRSGIATVATLSDDSAVFYFSTPSNWEMLIKVLDGCAINNRFWVFFAATTNVGFTLTVSDTETGETQEYTNPLGHRADAVTDTNAFATCP